MGDGTEAGLMANWKCMLAIVLVSMSPFQYGVDFGLIGGIQAMKGFLQIFGYECPTCPGGWNITPGRQQLISSLMTLGAVIASGFAGPIASFMGRKSCLWFACVLCCVADAIMMGTKSIGLLYFGRLLLGIANGMLMTFSQLYIQETAPSRYRGLALAAFQCWTSIGSLVGTVVDNFTAKIPGRNSYIVSLAIIYCIPAFICLGLFFIPESPRWLLEKGKTEKARKSLYWLRPNPDAVPGEIEEMQRVMAEEAALAKGVRVMDMFKGVDRRRTILAVAAVNTQAASGAMFMIAYGTYFFEMAGVGAPFENACILTGLGVLAILVNTAIITRYGRRRLFLITGLLICGFIELIVAVVYTVKPGSPQASKCIVGLSVLYIVGYNGMIATYAWLAGGEIPSQRLRSYTFGLATSTGFFGAWLATFTAPYFINPASLNWGPKYGYIWFPSCLIAAAFIYIYMPEIKDRTLEEITEMFEAKLPARKFEKYVCVGSAAAAEKQNEKEISTVEEIEMVMGDRKAMVETAMAVS